MGIKSQEPINVFFEDGNDGKLMMRGSTREQKFYRVTRNLQSSLFLDKWNLMPKTEVGVIKAE